jgi:hypothetical protein
MKVSLKRALLGLVAAVLLVGFVPAGLLLDRRLVAALEQGVRDDLSSAPLVLRDRFSSQGSARMMHARDIAAAPGLGAAISASDLSKADVRGVGLGLFTAAGLTRSRGGRIAATNRADGAGARLTIEIPLVTMVASKASA